MDSTMDPAAPEATDERYEWQVIATNGRWSMVTYDAMTEDDARRMCTMLRCQTPFSGVEYYIRPVDEKENDA